jgi:excisionase family DNA binding protein
MNKPTQFPFLSVRDVARATGLSIPAVYKHLEAKHLQALRPPGFTQYLISATALTEFMRARANGSYVRPPKRQTVAKEAK